MEEKTKQRFIGVIVIIGALFIILPFLFHNSRPTLQTNLSTNAPNSNVTVALPTAASTGGNTTNTSNTTVADNNNAVSTLQTQPSDTTNTTTQTQSADTNAASTASQTQTSNNAITTTTPQQATTPQATDMTTQAAPTTSNTTTQTITPATTSTTTSDSLAPASPNALTTGNANEGPTQPTQAVPATQNTTTPTNTTLPNTSAATPAKYVVKKRVAIKKQEIARMPINASTSAWEIQVAVFSDKENAEKMIAKLRAHHFEAYSRRVAVNRRHYIAIFVGPEINFARAEILKKDLRRDFQLSGEIKKYQA
ncbi:MAG TPA: SPOR domain-containing protein [Coxiellaceae bacterium]|nr:MAG: hypothetical protein A3E81_06570 [Gammaproteobacteria bacterium RIFCSPHIGHO2_12_FULL_36_30]HLB56509.1 SPOR domain-containing protein [Coxiellaceae bacterium]